MQASYTIGGMHCESCVSALSRAFSALPGVDHATVTLRPPQATIASAAPVALQDLQQAAASAGDYTLRPLSKPGEAEVPEAGGRASTLRRLYPLFLILAYLVAAVLVIGLATGERSLAAWMTWFMGGFFLVFSFFKLLDLPGFVTAYRQYDLLAQRWPAWAALYPFLELGLGLAYLARWQVFAANAVTFVVMLLGAAGVAAALRRRSAIRCACLGTALNLPMTQVTLAENLTMAAMAGWMLAAGQ